MGNTKFCALMFDIWPKYVNLTRSAFVAFARKWIYCSGCLFHATTRFHHKFIKYCWSTVRVVGHWPLIVTEIIIIYDYLWLFIHYYRWVKFIGLNRKGITMTNVLREQSDLSGKILFNYESWTSNESVNLAGEKLRDISDELLASAIFFILCEMHYCHHYLYSNVVNFFQLFFGVLTRLQCVPFDAIYSSRSIR